MFYSFGYKILAPYMSLLEKVLAIKE